jgi:hypothetical protein
VAEDGRATDIIQPCIVEPALQEIYDWHPSNAGRDYGFMHLPRSDANGDYAQADRASFSNAWHQDLVDVMVNLKLRPFLVTASPAVMLIDPTIEQVNTPLMLDWKVIHWMAVKDFDGQGEELHQDLITWRNTVSGKVAKSMFTWRPYRPLLQPQTVQAPRGVIRNERSNTEVAPPP